MRTAIYSKRFHTLEYFTSHNTTSFVNCYSLDQAKQIIKFSGIEQELHIGLKRWKFVPILR